MNSIKSPPITTATNTITVPGVMVSIFNRGCLITGPSGIGKSELALALLDRGHSLIADDGVDIAVRRQQLVGRAPTLLKNTLHLRDIGVIDVCTVYGTDSVLKSEKICYIIALAHNHTPTSENPLFPNLTKEKILGKSIPKLRISVFKHRNLALLLETFVKQGILSQPGSHPTEVLLHDHQQQIEAN